MPRLTPLSTGWTLRAQSGLPDSVAHLRDSLVPATVPGCVHTDLLAQDLIPDPYLDDNEVHMRWIGGTAWTYATDMEALANEAERVDLVAEGLDTVAEVVVNGQSVATTRNMHRTYRWDVRDQLQADGHNHVEVRFDSVYAEAERVAGLVGGHRPGPYPEPYNMVRKMACNFGWDWGPTLVTAGIWRPLYVHAWNTARLRRVRPLVRVVDGDGRVEALVDVERSGVGATGDLVLRLRVGEHETTAAVSADVDQGSVVLTVPSPELWFPRGYGGQALYDCQVQLETGDGTVLDRWERRLGFRTVELDTSPDPEGRTRFSLIVNDIPVFARGVNWIPDDCFPTRVDAARYRRRLEQACEAGVDLVRVWGGGLYETDEFYEVCDELGLMVWQDFLFACAAYPEEEPVRSEVEAEARENVARLMPHPSLILWNGNNENNWGHDVWNWKQPLGGRTWGEAYYLELLPAIVAEVDPTRPYWVGSPWSGSPDLPPNDPDHGLMHVWDVWNGRDYLAYREYVPPFVSEFGWQAPPTWSTLRRAVTDQPLEPTSPGVMHHQKAEGGQENLARGLAYHFPQPVSTQDWHHLTQVNQARALSVGIEHWRSHWPRVAGCIVWQLNDCWPVSSWSVIDGDGHRKPAWYALRRAYADRLVTVQPDGNGLVAACINQSAEEWAGTLMVSIVDFAGSVRGTTSVPVAVAPRTVVRVPLPSGLEIDDPAHQVLVAQLGAQRALWFAAEDLDLDYAADPLEVAVTPEHGGYAVRVTARCLARDIVLHADRLEPDAVVDDAAVTLLAGESATFHVVTSSRLDVAALGSGPVLMTVNDAVVATRALTGCAE